MHPISFFIKHGLLGDDEISGSGIMYLWWKVGLYIQ